MRMAAGLAHLAFGMMMVRMVVMVVDVPVGVAVGVRMAVHPRLCVRVSPVPVIAMWVQCDDGRS